MFSKHPKLTDEEIAFVKQLYAKEQKRIERKLQTSGEVPALPKATIYPGHLNRDTITALTNQGCTVYYLDDERGHAVATPKGTRYRYWAEIINSYQPELFSHVGQRLVAR